MRNKLVVPLLLLAALTLANCGKNNNKGYAPGTSPVGVTPVVTVPPGASLAAVCAQYGGSLGNKNGVTACRIRNTYTLNLVGSSRMALGVNVAVNDIVQVGVVGNVFFTVAGAAQSSTTFVSTATGALEALGAGVISVQNVQVTHCFDANNNTFSYCNF